ncbi:hypothetical protein J5N97_003882 [Dioscorea zingiberensis]|uniref:beta-galactosidase n=1 Tax=Dioscorea zingiberensis TaxID=325984 RepID=A0A9D5D5G2_9LILI|nr:hypothetical protein J5N97_003882 [Dioscorea zingiberensis]
MASSRRFKLLLILLAIVSLASFSPALPALSSPHRLHSNPKVSLHSPRLTPWSIPITRLETLGFGLRTTSSGRTARQLRIIGGDLHYFRVVPQYWKDRLLRAKALGLNTIQTYVPWNLHEPSPEKWVLREHGGHRIVSEDCSRAGISCHAPCWALHMCRLIDGGILLLKYFLCCTVTEDLSLWFRYTTDGGSKNTLDKGTIPGEEVYSAVDFSTGEDPWPIFQLQKKYNLPGKSPPLTAEFYTGWLTHWGEKIAVTDANSTAAALQKILSLNASAVLYMAHGWNQFWIFQWSKYGENEKDYKADLTSYDYDAPIKESGDVQNLKFKALRNVIQKYSRGSLPPFPTNNEIARYGPVKVSKVASLFQVLHALCDPIQVIETDQPVSMESIGQVENLGITFCVILDGTILHRWRLYPVSFNKLSSILRSNPIMQVADPQNVDMTEEPRFYQGSFFIDHKNHVKDTYISFRGWTKGIAFVNNFNIGRFWPLMGPQCTLYVPAPILQHGENIVVILELHSPHPELMLNLVDNHDFSC